MINFIIRCFDLLISIVAILVLLPFFILIILMIRLGSKGSAFYIQKRVGKNSGEFRMFKFRTMYPDSDKKSLITIGSRDPRITPVGYFLRKYKLDELPQLFNVLIGNMSVVGPRPEVLKYVDLYTPEERIILSVPPGITDYASIAYSNENEMLVKAEDAEALYIQEILPAKIKLNKIYIEKRSIQLYFRIIFKTLFR